MPQIIIIAGPNGAGKKSFANKHFDGPRALSSTSTSGVRRQA
jgi:predicted ABC-type ATPase